MKLPPRYLGVAAAVGLVLGGVVAARLFGLVGGTSDQDCIRPTDAEFGRHPLGARLGPEVFLKDRAPTNTCRTPSDLGESCGFQGEDGLAYHLIDGFVLNKELSLAPRQATRGPLGITRDSRLETVRRRLDRMGADPRASAEDGATHLISSLCEPTESSWFTIKFDAAGKARAVELSSQI
jgi:hypothetical protein